MEEGPSHLHPFDFHISRFQFFSGIFRFPLCFFFDIHFWHSLFLLPSDVKSRERERERGAANPIRLSLIASISLPISDASHQSFSMLKFFSHTSVCIYIYAVESKLGPTINLVQFSQFFFFLFFFQKSSSFCRENEILKKNEQKKDLKKHNFLSQNLVQLCCATYLDQVLTQPWTKF